MTSTPVTAVAPASSATYAIRPCTFHMHPTSQNVFPAACRRTTSSRSGCCPANRRRARAARSFSRQTIAVAFRRMQVTVRLFAQLRERAGASEVSIELPDGARVRDAIAELGPLTGELPVVMAVNREYADADTPLAAGDELALIPPVSGGGQPWARITTEPLSADRLAERVRD